MEALAAGIVRCCVVDAGELTADFFEQLGVYTLYSNTRQTG